MRINNKTINDLVEKLLKDPNQNESSNGILKLRVKIDRFGTFHKRSKQFLEDYPHFDLIISYNNVKIRVFGNDKWVLRQVIQNLGKWVLVKLRIDFTRLVRFSFALNMIWLNDIDEDKSEMNRKWLYFGLGREDKRQYQISRLKRFKNSGVKKVVVIANKMSRCKSCQELEFKPWDIDSAIESQLLPNEYCEFDECWCEWYIYNLNYNLPARWIENQIR